MMFVAGSATAPMGDAWAVAKDGVNLREGPGKDHPVLATLALGQTASEVGREGDWVQIHLDGADAPSGRVHRSLLTPAPTAAAGQTAPSTGLGPIKALESTVDQLNTLGRNQGYAYFASVRDLGSGGRRRGRYPGVARPARGLPRQQFRRARKHLAWRGRRAHAGVAAHPRARWRRRDGIGLTGRRRSHRAGTRSLARIGLGRRERRVAARHAPVARLRSWRAAAIASATAASSPSRSARIRMSRARNRSASSGLSPDCAAIRA
ncbi:MAG: hypothetical protein FJX36_09200 [Alphaproteobacteria bacterium]|nr:hypothetical protein [Alphaproteobacteria bacterium]